MGSHVKRTVRYDLVLDTTSKDEGLVILNCKRIGSGTFSIAYHNENTNLVYIRTIDTAYCKELLTHITGNSIHFPKITWLHDVVDYNYKWYVMPYYDKLSKAYPIAWKDFNLLKAIRNRLHHNQTLSDVDMNANFLRMIEESGEDSYVFQKFFEPIEYLINMANNYQNMLFEPMSTQNYKVDKENGELIFLDPCFTTKD